MTTRSFSVRAATVAVALATCLTARGDESQHSRRPARFAMIFSMGYAADRMPKDAADFEKMIVAIKQASFNTILCKYTPERGEICKKQDVQIFVDLLVPEHHIYRNVEGAKKLCESLHSKEVVYGYHLWSDNIGGSYPGRSRDVKNVHLWDPTHAVYVGTYRMSRVSRVEGLDLLGYYDFHWKRGGHWGHLSKAMKVAKGKNALFLRYCDAAPGRIGAGNPNRAGYTIATSIPFGLKGYLFHYRGGVVDGKTWQLDALGKDLQKVNGKFATIGKELMAIGNPTAVYSTPITKTAKDRPTGSDPAVPGGLSPVPTDLAFAITSGEVLLGLFKDKEKRDVVVFASHNAYQPQKVTLQFKAPTKRVEFFDRAKGMWRELKTNANQVTFHVEEDAVELIRVEH